MSIRQIRPLLPIISLLPAAALVLLLARGAANAEGDPALTKGRALYSQYCRSCHGEAATGDGPAASALKIRPADLTRIAKRYNGFPNEKVMDWIDGEKFAVGHGSREMPVWGKRFRRTAEGETGAPGEIPSLARYLESIQR